MNAYRIFYKDAPYICSIVITAATAKAAVAQFKSDSANKITAVIKAN